jgi:hypothetical protein
LFAVPSLASPQGRSSDPCSGRRLEQALFLTLACHALAMVGTAVLLLPMVPGGGTSDDAVRVARIAASPMRWRLGWSGWQLAAVSDVLLAAALLRTPWVPRTWAVLSGTFTAAAVALDQTGQALLVTRGVALAERAAHAGELARYLRFEAIAFPLTGTWAAILYCLAGVGWAAAFAGARTWTRGLTALSVALYGLLLVVSVGMVLPPPARLAPSAVCAGNAVGFILLEAWFVLVIERVLRRARPDTPHGRDAPWKYPRRGAFARAFEAIANSRFVRSLTAYAPVLEFRSDITDVVYVNYLVSADRLGAYVPPGLELQRLGPSSEYALFSVLTYRHGHLGPSAAGLLRRLFSSPVQSNWRTYVRDPATAREGIYFVTNAVTTRLHAIGARLVAEGMPMHLLARGEVARTRSGETSVRLEPGIGSAPDLEAILRKSAPPRLAPPWSECFRDYREMLAYCVPQDRAMSTQPWRGTTTRQEIELGIPLESCEALEGEVRSRAARAIVGDAAPLCFRVAKVAFRLAGEERDWPRGRPGPSCSGPSRALRERIGGWGHFWGHRAMGLAKAHKVDSDPATTDVGLDKDTKPSN